jgi:hypothetical protein
MKRALAISASLALLAPPALLFAKKAPDWVLRAGATKVAPELTSGKPAPDALVLWRQQIVTAGGATGSTRLYRREAIRILNAAGAEAGTFYSDYDDDSKVVVEGAWTVKPDGSSEELDLKSVVSIQQAHAEFFTDNYVVAFRPPRLAPGDIAAHALWRKSRKDVYQWIVPLQDSLPVAAQEVAFDLPDGWTHAWRLTSAPDGYTGPLSGEGASKASYLFPAQRGLPEENSGPPASDRFARMELVILPPAGKFPELVYKSWKDVGAWFYRKSLPARGEAAADLVPASSGEAAAATGRWVQDKVRYVALEVGEGGYVPREPALVARRLYGDCKDKVFLMMALLRQKKVESFPVLTRSLDDGEIDPKFPSPVQFNHVIVAVRAPSPTGLPAEVLLPDGPYVLFDPTSAWTPWGQLPEGLQGARGLVVRADGAELIDFPYASPEINRFVRTVDAELSSDGRLTAKIANASEGALSQRGWYQSQTPEERKESALRFAEGWVPGSRAADLVLANLDDASKPLDARFTVTSEGYLRKSGSLLVLPVLPFSVGPARIPRLEDRRSPIDLGCPRRRELTVRWKLPAGLKIDAAPDPVSADNAYVAYRFSAAVEDGHLVATETYEIKKPTIPLSDLPAWKAVETASAKASGSRAVLAR